MDLVRSLILPSFEYIVFHLEDMFPNTEFDDVSCIVSASITQLMLRISYFNQVEMASASLSARCMR